MSKEALLIAGASSDLAINLIHSVMKGPHPPRVLAHFHSSGERIDELQSTFPDLIYPLRADLSIAAERERLISEVRSICGSPNKIVHFAGLKLRLERFWQADLASFEADLAVQLSAIVRILREFLPAMAKSPTRTKVVFVLSSVTIDVPPKFMALYTVTKYAQLGLMRALAAEYAGTSVDVNAVSPAMVETRFLSNLPQKIIEMAAAKSPLGRNVAAEEVTAAIEFLLSSGSDHLSGANTPVPGGATH